MRAPRTIEPTVNYKYLVRHGGVEELYDLTEDPGEANNLADQLPEIVVRMKRMFADQMAVFSSVPTLGGHESYEGRARVRESLRSLGYIQ